MRCGEDVARERLLGGANARERTPPWRPTAYDYDYFAKYKNMGRRTRLNFDAHGGGATPDVGHGRELFPRALANVIGERATGPSTVDDASDGV